MARGGDKQPKDARVEVRVRHQGRPYNRVFLTRSPASIGRSEEADIRLDSKHVSRVHAKLHFEGAALRLVDAGSTNGFVIRGKRHRDARVTSGDVVELCGFELEIRWTQPTKAQPLEEELSEGWAEMLADDETSPPEDTQVKKRPQPPPGHPAAFKPDPTVPIGSVLNRVTHDSGEPAAASDEELEEDELEELRAPDLPPLLKTLHEEANALLYNDPNAGLAIEVIVAMGDRVANVELLQPGQSSWWGGTPRGLEHLWVVPTGERFPMVTHRSRGEYQVHIPDDPRWKMFQRGRVAVDVHRSGPLIGCNAEPEAQVEVNYGPFAAYVRCVRTPQRMHWRLPWKALRPDRWVGVALLLSLLLHTAALALPVKPLPMVNFRLGPGDEFVDVTVQSTTPPSAPEAETPAPMPPLSAPPPEVLVDFEQRQGSGSQRTRQRRKPLRQTPPEPDAADNESPQAQELATVSVSDFRVSGLIPHLPTVKIDDQTAPLMRGGATILRGTALPGVMTKHGAMTQRPGGRLPDKVIMRVINAHAHEIEKCYQTSLRQDPRLRGRLEVEWIVERIGVVKTVRIIYDDVGSAGMARCVRTRVRAWVFPPPAGGAASVSFPFVFSNLRR